MSPCKFQKQTKQPPYLSNLAKLVWCLHCVRVALLILCTSVPYCCISLSDLHIFSSSYIYIGIILANTPIWTRYVLAIKYTWFDTCPWVCKSSCQWMIETETIIKKNKDRISIWSYQFKNCERTDLFPINHFTIFYFAHHIAQASGVNFLGMNLAGKWSVFTFSYRNDCRDTTNIANQITQF